MPEPRTVLLIDDEPAICFSVSSYLEDSGYVVHVAGDGEEGIATFARSPADVVITDLRMAKLDGLGVIAIIRARSPTTPIIAVSGNPQDCATAVRCGARLCLEKPIQHLSCLVEAIESLTSARL